MGGEEIKHKSLSLQLVEYQKQTAVTAALQTKDELMLRLILPVLNLFSSLLAFFILNVLEMCWRFDL